MSADIPAPNSPDALSVELTIEGFAPEGDGVGHLQGRSIFVPGTLPGERVRVEPGGGSSSAQDRGPRVGRLIEVVVASPDRRAPTCPYFGVCGGCQWLHVAPHRQREAKAWRFVQALGDLLGNLDVPPIAHADQDLGYRSRATLHVSRGRPGFSRKGAHAIVPVRACPLLDARLDAALGRLSALLDGSTPGAPQLPRGCADIALACDDEHVSAAFFLDRLSQDAAARLEAITRRVALKGSLAMVDGRVARTFGKPLLARSAPCSAGARLRGRPDLFAQAHARANALLVAQVLACLDGAESVLELYGGSGNFSLALAERVKKIVSIELCAPALELARQSAREANLESVRFIAGDALQQARALARASERFDALLLDPPRGGAPGIAEVARTLGVDRVVYVSCNMATLARDAHELADAGYRITFARPFDLFPQTVHLEGVVAFERARR